MCKTEVIIEDYSDYNLKTFPEYLYDCINNNKTSYKMVSRRRVRNVIVDISPMECDTSFFKKKYYRLNIVAILTTPEEDEFGDTYGECYLLKVEKWFYETHLGYRIDYWKQIKKKMDHINIKIEMYRDLHDYLFTTRNELKIK